VDCVSAAKVQFFKKKDSSFKILMFCADELMFCYFSRPKSVLSKNRCQKICFIFSIVLDLPIQKIVSEELAVFSPYLPCKVLQNFSSGMGRDFWACS
jgi:hypothetical protein